MSCWRSARGMNEAEGHCPGTFPRGKHCVVAAALILLAANCRGGKQSGPESFWLGTANPTGLAGKEIIQELCDGPPSVWGIAETHLTALSAKSPFQYCVQGCPAPCATVVSSRAHASLQVASWWGLCKSKVRLCTDILRVACT